MGGWAFGDVTKWQIKALNGINTSTSANTKGSWYEITAATEASSSYLMIMKRWFSTVGDFLLDIGIGAAGSEYVILNNLLMSSNTLNQNASSNIVIPYKIPKGVRVAVRVQSTEAAANEAQMAFGFGAAGFLSSDQGSFIDTYGVNTADSGATVIDPGGTAYTFGNYVELTSALTRTCRGIFLGFGNITNTARTRCNWEVQVGIGGAGSEVAIIPMLGVSALAATDGVAPFFTPVVPITIPAGTRVAVKAACWINDATDRLFDCALYAVG